MGKKFVEGGKPPAEENAADKAAENPVEKQGEKKSKTKRERKPGDPFPGPDPEPKAGDTVGYRFGDTAGAEFRDTVTTAKATFIHEGHEGRLINIEVETKQGPLRIGPVPYRGIDDEPAGNTWHWPAE
jgi:hypothetical protein